MQHLIDRDLPRGLGEQTTRWGGQRQIGPLYSTRLPLHKAAGLFHYFFLIPPPPQAICQRVEVMNWQLIP